MSARAAVAVKFHPVMKDFEAMAPRNPVLKGFKPIVFKFENLSTTQADEMVMVGSLGSGFISGLTIGKFSLGGKTQAGEKLKGPIDRGITDLRIRFGHLGIDLRKVFMAGGVEEDVEDLRPLPGGLQPLFRDQGLKSVGLHGSPFLKMNFNFILRDASLFVNTQGH
jgi:hypothetical protein